MISNERLLTRKFIILRSEKNHIRNSRSLLERNHVFCDFDPESSWFYQKRGNFNQ